MDKELKIIGAENLTDEQRSAVRSMYASAVRVYHQYHARPSMLIGADSTIDTLVALFGREMFADIDDRWSKEIKQDFDAW